MNRLAFAAILVSAATWSVSASAHCDTTQGPVVSAARSALVAGDVNLVLHWVRAEDEHSIRAAFGQTLAVRGLGPQAMLLADRSFFETLVRIHRAGEGAAYTGLTDAPPEPIIAATDSALEHGSADELEKQLVGLVRSGLAERFRAANAAKAFRPGDVAAGRAFVAAYVPLTHWVEGVFTAASGSGEHHGLPAHDKAAHVEPAHMEPAHVEPAHGAIHEETTSHGSGSHPDAPHREQYLPWILAALFAIAASVEAVLLVRRQRRVTA